MKHPARNGRVTAAVAVGLLAGIVVGGYLLMRYGRKVDSEPDPAGLPVADAGTLPTLTLPEADRKYLWECEHHGTLLTTFGFSRWKQALSAGDAAAMAAILSESFTAELPDESTGPRVEAGFIRVARTADDAARIEVDRHRFIAWMTEHRQRFAADPRAEISLMALQPAARDLAARRWEGNCRIRLFGETAPGSPMELVFYIDFALDRPTQESLESGAWLHRCEVTRVKRADAPGYLMKDRARDWGFDTSVLHDNWNEAPQRMIADPGGVFVWDYNRDGLLDVLVTDMSLHNGYVLYQGVLAGKFLDVTRRLQLPRTRPSPVALIDIDGDGWEDIVLGWNLILRNDQGRAFEDVTHRCNLAKLIAEPDDGIHRTGLVVADYDGDGQLDLYVTRSSSNVLEGSWVDGKIGDLYENQLLRNLGDWQFEDVTRRTGTGGGKRSTFTAAWLDADNNGRPDLYVIHEFGNGLLLLNDEDGTFREQTLVDAPADYGSMGITTGDIDNDGLIDLYVGNMYSKSGQRVMSNLRDDAYDPLLNRKLRRMVAGSQLYRNRGSLRFDPMAMAFDVADIGWSYGPALVDLDNDGWLDLHATCGFISRTRDKPDG